MTTGTRLGFFCPTLKFYFIFKTSVKRFRLSEKNESEIENQKDNYNTEYDLILKKDELISFDDIKIQATTNHTNENTNFTLISI